MEFCGFFVSSVRYPNAAEGWVDGVYHKRIAERLRADVMPAEGGGIVIGSRHFREKEETGWGVFDYVEAPEFSFGSGLRDYVVRAVFRNGGDDEIAVSAFCNDILKLHKAVLPAGEETEVTFNVASVYDTTRVVFFVMNEDVSDKNAAPTHELTLLSLTAEEMPAKTAGKKPTVFLASDSTVQTYDPYYYPQTGWGEVLYKYFKDSDFVREYRPEGSTYSHCRAYELPEITVENRAIGGRSSLSFYLEGKFDELLLRAKPGDFVFIQFGHNDATKARPNRYVAIPEYKEMLRTYCKACSARGLTPVLVTPVMRRNYHEDTDSFSPSFPEHRDAMLALAEEEGVTLLDLGGKSHEICTELGGEMTKSLFLWTAPDTYDGAYKNGSTDSTHLQRRGALVFAGALCQLIRDCADERLAAVAAQQNGNKCYTDYLK